VPFFLAALLVVGLIGVIFADGIRQLVDLWSTKEEYSHAYLIPLISLYLAWQKKNELMALEWRGSWLGVALVAFGLLVCLLGTLSTLYVVIQYALIIVVAGVVLSFVGAGGMRYLWVPLVFLFFMVPLPQFLYQAMSTKLQLISSELGVAVIRAFGISVFLEGNVIDLGSYKLQVVEACNGLRYLFPLASFGFLCAYLYRGPIWHRVVLFLSTAPITVLMNSFRIGVIGASVEYWGEEMAEGFLHDFEGWAIFMACTVVLFVEIWLLTLLQRPRVSFRDAFYLDIPGPGSGQRPVPWRGLRGQHATAMLLLGVATLGSLSIGSRGEAIPTRRSFIDFPLALDGWSGRADVLEDVYLKALKLDDYVLVNYVSPDRSKVVNFYAAYYQSQRAGQSAHSPRSCIPGGGWKIENLSKVDLAKHAANRVEIALGQNRQLVYYWFQQRGRFITNEYLVKWFLFWDALTRNRSDGALVRLTTQVLPNEDWMAGDKRLQQFAAALADRLDEYVPN
jgi:exosortase D (VPLPA-CTERM-specific)